MKIQNEKDFRKRFIKKQNWKFQKNYIIFQNRIVVFEHEFTVVFENIFVQVFLKHHQNQILDFFFYHTICMADVIEH